MDVDREQWGASGGEYSLATASSTRSDPGWTPGETRCRWSPGFVTAAEETSGSHGCTGSAYATRHRGAVLCLPEVLRIMDVGTWVWPGTLVCLGALLVFDLIIVGRRPHEPSLKESTIWVVAYVSLAVAFGAGVGLHWGGELAKQFFTGWLT